MGNLEPGRVFCRPVRSMLGVALWCALSMLAANGQPPAAMLAIEPLVREEFLAALAQSGAEDSSHRDSDALIAYPLYPYLVAARIAAALERPEPSLVNARAADFLQRHRGEPVARELRKRWLLSLAGKSEWSRFIENYEADYAEPELHCLYLQARAATEANLRPEVQGQMISLWLTPRQLPPECEPVFETMRVRGILTEDLIEQRVRRLLENGRAPFARVIARGLSPVRAEPLMHWARLVESPRSAIDELLENPAQPVEIQALLDGWARLARNEPVAALERFAELGRTWEFDRAQRERIALALALGLAWDRRAVDALEIFDRISEDALDDYALGWRARAAAWQGRWKVVEDSIAAMSPEQQGHVRWRYWAGRAASEQGKDELAKALFESVQGRDNYYAALAAARLGRVSAPTLEILPRDSGVLEHYAQLPAFRRAHELLQVGFRERALLEWRFGLASLEPSDRGHAIHLAAAWNWHDVAVATATEHSVFNDYPLLYPTPYGEVVQREAVRSGLEPALLFALMRQESLYRPDAGSGAGALGLMQLMPDTARRVAIRAGIEPPARAELLDPAVNIRLGAAHLKELIEQFNQRLVVALAGYNAGPNAAARWLPDEPKDADVWIENIPYNETREYVQRVLWHTIVFKWLDSGEGQRVDHWLAAVGPLEAPVRVGQLRGK